MGTVDVILPLNPGQMERLESLDPLRKLCRQVHLVKLEATRRVRRAKVPGLTLAKRWMTFGKPTQVPTATGELQNLRDELYRQHYDLIFCFRLRSFTLMPLLFDPAPNRPKVFVDFDDVESIALRREFLANKETIGFEQGQILRLEVIETARSEARALQHSDGVSVCSEIDAQRLRSKSPKARICVVPNSLPRQRVLALPDQEAQTRILFLGTMTYHPNEDAALHFCREILPMIRANTKRKFLLDIVGRGPSTTVKALGEGPNVEVVGGVESVEPYYARSDIVIAPIRFGGGTRIKILEALAFGRAVVSTTIGAEGLDLVPGRDILIADTPADFAAACVRLAEDETYRMGIARAGRSRFEALYESRRVQDKLIDDLREILTAPNFSTDLASTLIR